VRVAPFASVVRVVGSSRTSLPKLRACPFPVSGCVVGVGSDEDPRPSVRCADVGRSYNVPLRVIPEAGKVANDGIEAEGNMPPYIFQHDESGS
jgi:hypothetical protein